MQRPYAHALRTLALLLATCACAWPTLADLVHPIEGEPVAGRITLQAGSTNATLTDSEGKRTEMALIDLADIRFGAELVAVRGGDLMLINNDRQQLMNRMTGKIRLRAGLHRFVIPYWQADAAMAVSLHVSGPGIEGEAEVRDALLRCFRNPDEEQPPDSPGIDAEGFRLPELSLKDGEDKRRFLPRAEYRYYIGDKAMPFKNMDVLSQMTKLERRGNTTTIGTNLNLNPDQYFALVFEGFFRAEQDGEYTFALASDDGSQLHFGKVDRFRAEALASDGETGPTPWRFDLRNEGVALGELTSIADGVLTLKLPLGEDAGVAATLTLPQVLAVWDSAADASAINRANEPANQDTAYIRDKDDPAVIRSVSGKIKALDDQSLTFEFRGQDRTIGRERIAGLVLAHADRPAPPRPGFHQTLSLRSGQILPGKLIALDDEQAAFELIGGGRVQVPRSVMIALRCENGRRVDLTRIDPTAEEAIPYFGLSFKHRVNQSFAGDEVRLFNGTTYERALAVHSKSRLHYKLDRPAESFRADFGLLDPGGKLGNVTARVIGDDKVLWEQADITAKSQPIQVQVDLTGVKRLVLEVDFGQGQDVGDRAAWCNPRLIYAAEP